MVLPWFVWQGDFMLQGVACAATCLAIRIASDGRCGAERPSTRTLHPSTQGRPVVGSLGATSVATDMAMGRPNLHNDLALVYVCFGA